jgi:predicted membrane-bound spermidine synthase
VASVTIVVTAFMLGLGLGSFAGGRLSRDPARPVLLWFAGIEFGIGAFGVASLGLFHQVGSFTAGASGPATFALAFGLVLVPTVLMGATLPLLVAHTVRHLGNVGRSVGTLYFVNTLGSALAAFATALVLLGRFGQQRTVLLAAALNAAVGCTMIAGWLWARRRT